MSKPLKEDYIIRIKSRIEQHVKEPVEQEEKEEFVELMTRGQFVQKGGSYYITYKRDRDHRIRGLHHHPENCRRRQPRGGCCGLARAAGPAPSCWIEKGKRNLCHYETGYGSMTLGVTADEIECGLTEKAAPQSSATCWMPTAPSL